MAKNMVRYFSQAVFYALFVAFIGYFSVAPAYEHFPPDQALIKVSFSHPGQPKEECRVRTQEELDRLPPNMRAPMLCGRERSPLLFDLELNGKPLHRAELPPSGLSRDGSSTIYRRFPLPAGRYHLRARLKDSVRVPDFNYTKEADVDIAPGKVFVVDFNPITGGFVFK